MIKDFIDSSSKLYSFVNIYADGYVLLRASDIYSDISENLIKAGVSNSKRLIKNSHIYMIGTMPKLKINNWAEKIEGLYCDVSVFDKSFEVFLGDEFKNQYDLSNLLHKKINEKIILEFDVKYIGKSYGKNGSSNSIKRLMNHEKLQEISLKGIDDQFELYVLMFEVKSDNQMMLKASKKFTDYEYFRIQNSAEVLKKIKKEEQVSIFEASLINYFKPDFNKLLKNTFPSKKISY